MTSRNKFLTNASLARKLVIYVVLFSSLLTLIITASQLYYEYTIDLENIDDSLNQISSVHLGAISENVWAVDIHNAQTQLDGILSIPDFEYLEISENDKVWISAGRKKSRNVIEKTYPLVHLTQGEQRVIGNLKVIAALDPVYDKLLNKAITVLVSNGVKTFFVSGFMLILFYNLVTRHLIKIADFARNHDIDNENSQFLSIDYPPAKAGNKDELATLIDCLNEMQKDITQNYIKLKASEEKHRQLVELAQEGIWTIDEKGKTIFVNPSMAIILGYSVDEMMGKHLFDFMDEKGKELAKHKMEQRQSGIRETHDFEFIRKDGKRIYTTLAAAPIFDSNGKYSGAIAGVLDMTKRKQAENELILHKQHLEELIKERTRALELSNKELEAFSYSVAHDLRTPLRSITSFSQILEIDEASNVSQAGRDAINRIVRAGKSMAELIDELLELSRITRININPTVVNLSHIAENIISQLKSSSPERNARIIIRENIEITADKTLMHILLQNLIQNSWKFTHNNDVTVIEIGQDIKNNTQCFFVKDNGIGFDMQYKNKLFEAFQRLHGSEYSGNGIGLATVKRIINRHSGEIWAESSENKGTIFYFTIPERQQAPQKAINL